MAEMVPLPHVPQYAKLLRERDELRARLDRPGHTLAIIRAEYARYQTSGDLHELARAIGQVLGDVPLDEAPDWINNPQPVQRPAEDGDG